MQPVFSKVPFLHTPGNHEMEPLPGQVFMKSYNARYPSPIDPSKPPSNLGPVTGYGSKVVPNNLYHAATLPGVKVVSITSYIPGDDFSPASAQYRWLEAELKKVGAAARLEPAD